MQGKESDVEDETESFSEFDQSEYEEFLSIFGFHQFSLDSIDFHFLSVTHLLLFI